MAAYLFEEGSRRISVNLDHVTHVEHLVGHTQISVYVVGEGKPLVLIYKAPTEAAQAFDRLNELLQHVR
jgi:hypothetical protein